MRAVTELWHCSATYVCMRFVCDFRIMGEITAIPCMFGQLGTHMGQACRCDNRWLSKWGKILTFEENVGYSYKMGLEQKLVFLHCIIHPKVCKSVQKVNHVVRPQFFCWCDWSNESTKLQCTSLFVLEMYSLVKVKEATHSTFWPPPQVLIHPRHSARGIYKAISRHTILCYLSEEVHFCHLYSSNSKLPLLNQRLILTPVISNSAAVYPSAGWRSTFDEANRTTSSANILRPPKRTPAVHKS